MTEQFWVKEDHRAPLIITLVGPIEYWWDRPEDPDRFRSIAARRYRSKRNEISNVLVAAGYLVYRPHEAFKGGWDERCQEVNDAMIRLSDVVVDMTPAIVPYGRGTARELEIADEAGIVVVRSAGCTTLELLIRLHTYTRG